MFMSAVTGIDHVGFDGDRKSLGVPAKEWRILPPSTPIASIVLVGIHETFTLLDVLLEENGQINHVGAPLLARYLKKKLRVRVLGSEEPGHNGFAP